MSLKTILNKSIIKYLILAFGIAWTFWIPACLLVFYKIIAPTSIIFIAFQSLGAIAPTIAAIYIFKKYQKEDTRSIFRKYLPQKAPLSLYFLALFLLPLLTLITIFVSVRVGIIAYPISQNTPFGEIVNDVGILGIIALLPLMVLAYIPSSPLLEELGWRGFLLPELQKKHNNLLGGIILGLIWGTWHLPLVLSYGDNLLTFYILIVLHTLIGVWLFVKTSKSLFIAILYHASLNVALVNFHAGISEWIFVFTTSTIFVLLLIKDWKLFNNIVIKIEHGKQ